jgi:hypothetical protein
MKWFLRTPAVHFLVAGGLLFALRASWWPAPPDERPRIVLGADQVQQLRAEWTARHGAAPDPDAERALIDDALDEEILQREALAAGLDRQDPLVRERLGKLTRFLGEVSEDATTRQLGLTERDAVIRRHLTQVMRLALSRLDASDMPDDAELQAFLDAHGDVFARPAALRLTHVYLSRQRRGAGLARDAARLLDALRREAVPPETAPARGDAFLRGSDPPAATDAELDRLFGAGFAAALRDAPTGRWIGPIPSSYGLHLVWIRERTPARMPPLDSVRAQVAYRLLEARARDRLRSRLDRLRARYDITVEQ